MTDFWLKFSTLEVKTKFCLLCFSMFRTLIQRKGIFETCNCAKSQGLFVDTKKYVVYVPKPQNIKKMLNQWQVRMFRWPNTDPKRKGAIRRPRNLRIRQSVQRFILRHVNMTIKSYHAKKGAYDGEIWYQLRTQRFIVGYDSDKETVKASGIKWASF